MHGMNTKNIKLDLYRVTHGNLTSFEWVVLSRLAEMGDEVVGILFLWVGHFSSNGDLTC